MVVVGLTNPMIQVVKQLFFLNIYARSAFPSDVCYRKKATLRQVKLRTRTRTAQIYSRTVINNLTERSEQLFGRISECHALFNYTICVVMGWDGMGWEMMLGKRAHTWLACRSIDFKPSNNNKLPLIDICVDEFLD